MELDDYANTIRLMIVHEDNLRHQRMTWMLSLQAFLLAGVYFVWDKHWTMTLCFCVLGGVSCLSLAVVLATSVKAVHVLLKKWEARVCERVGEGRYEGPPVIGLHPKELRPLVHRACPWYSLPAILLVGWVFLLMVRVIEACGA